MIEAKAPIEFHYHPHKFNESMHAVEKSEGDTKRRYLYGISSGVKTDGDGERLTQEAIDDMLVQANSGDVLLYAGKHDVNFIDDVGILNQAKILENGDWWTEYRLYDDADGVGPNTLENVEKLWRQVTGTSPYKKPKQKGFSIEGFIPADGIQSIKEIGDRKLRVIKQIILEGVVVVSRPSYKDSIATAVYKALGELSPWKEQSFRKGINETLAGKIQSEKVSNDFHNQKYEVSNALDEMISTCMSGEDGNKRDKLRIIFDEYREIMIPILLNAEGVFIDEVVNEEIEYASPVERQTNTLYKDLSAKIGTVIKSIEGRIQCYHQKTNKS